MVGQLIISFDCEGKWGMADHLGALEHTHIRDDALAQTYDRLAALLARYEIPATFAFVMAFLLDQDERAEFADLLNPSGPDDSWIAHVAREQRAFPEGWFVPSTLASVAHGGMHEIACHGFSHRSLGAGEISRPDADKELVAARSVASRKGVDLRTIIFPRNRIGHLSLLRDHGYLGYRTRKPGGRLPPPVANLVEEFNLFTPSEPIVSPPAGEIVAIPHGHFFNWRQGRRRMVPPAVTVWRWQSLLDRAVQRGEVAHLWLHPHNFITGPGTWKPFEQVVSYARTLRETGKLRILTQVDYCRALASDAAGAAVN